MERRTNNQLLNHLVFLHENQAKEQLDSALKTSIELNRLSGRVKTLENYLKSDPETNSEGVVEKLNTVVKSVDMLKTKAKIYGLGGAGVVLVIKWIISRLI